MMLPSPCFTWLYRAQQSAGATNQLMGILIRVFFFFFPHETDLSLQSLHTGSEWDLQDVLAAPFMLQQCCTSMVFILFFCPEKPALPGDVTALLRSLHSSMIVFLGAFNVKEVLPDYDMMKGKS